MQANEGVCVDGLEQNNRVLITNPQYDNVVMKCHGH